MPILTTIYVITTLVFTILLFVDAIRFRRDVMRFIRVGLLCGFVSVAFDVAALFLLSRSDGSAVMVNLPTILAIDGFVFAKTALFACVGMYCATSLGNATAPLALRWRAFRPAPTKEHRSTETPSDLPGEDQLVIQVIPTHVDHDLAVEQRPDTDMRGAALISGAVIGGAVVYSWILFALVDARLAESFRMMSEVVSAQFGIGDEPTLLLAVIVTAFAFGEEIIFRLGLQSYLAKNLRLEGGKYWIAIVIATTIWSLGHGEILEPIGIKYAQVFPLGIALGWLFRRFGIETAIATHAVFNLIMMFLGAHMIQA